MPAGGDPRTSATEIYRLVVRIDEVRVKRWGKSPPGPWKHGFYDVNSIPKQHRGGTIGLPGRSEEVA